MFVGDMLRAVIASGSPLGGKIKKVSVTLLVVPFTTSTVTTNKASFFLL